MLLKKALIYVATVWFICSDLCPQIVNGKVFSLSEQEYLDILDALDRF